MKGLDFMGNLIKAALILGSIAAGAMIVKKGMDVSPYDTSMFLSTEEGNEYLKRLNDYASTHPNVKITSKIKNMIAKDVLNSK